MAKVALITWAQFPAPALLTRAESRAGTADGAEVVDAADLDKSAEADQVAKIVDVDIYALPETDLGTFDGVLIGTGADQRDRAEQRERLQEFLECGGTIVYCGHVAYPFLDGLSEFVPLGRYRLEDLRVSAVAPHPLFDTIASDDLTFRKGVAGFYGRGHNPPPADAVVFNVIGSGRAPVDWMRRYRNDGVLLVHAGNDLWGHGEDDSGAAVLPGRLLRWIAERSAAHRIEIGQR